MKTSNKSICGSWEVSRHPDKAKFYVTDLKQCNEEILVYSMLELKQLAVAIIAFEKMEFESQSILNMVKQAEEAKE